ncbi:MAG: NUDIX domain-containing protein [Alphaproteobacteria bacterium]|nr:NUDIX domain-containing protein [Alphaproteobacteria bacterium]
MHGTADTAQAQQETRTLRTRRWWPGRKPYRVGVGIVLFNSAGQMLVGKRLKAPGAGTLQLPQGGINTYGKAGDKRWRCESPYEALMREVKEELGLRPEQVRVIGQMRGQTKMVFPDRGNGGGKYRGQKHYWFALQVVDQYDPKNPLSDAALLQQINAHVSSASNTDKEFTEAMWANPNKLWADADNHRRDAYSRVENAFAQLRSYFTARKTLMPAIPQPRAQAPRYVPQSLVQ